MKSIKKKENGLFGFVITLMIIAILAVLFVFLAKRDIIHVKGLSSETDSRNMRSVAYVGEAYGAGYSALDAVSMWSYDANDSQFIVPEDVITESDLRTGVLDGMVLKYAVAPNTFLTKSMICPVDTDEFFNDTTREVAVSYIDSSGNAVVGDYVDIRFRVSSYFGDSVLRDDIVLSKKEIIAVNGSFLVFRLSEDELMQLTAAGVEKSLIQNHTYKNEETRLNATIYTTKYVNIAQHAAKVTYDNETAIALMRTNPNLVNNPSALYKVLLGEDGKDASVKNAG